MMIRAFLTTLFPLLLLGSALAEEPDVLVIDDFSEGIGRWENRGTGSLSRGEGEAAGSSALVWEAQDDGMGHIVYANPDCANVDFSRYDLMLVRLKFSGKPLWSFNPIIRQAPLTYGFRALYWSLNTLAPFDQWFTLSQDLHAWGNAAPDSYDKEAQEFEFEVHQLVGEGHTRIAIDRITLVRNPLEVPPSAPGHWERLRDGSQATTFPITVRNRGQKPVTLAVEWFQADETGGVRRELPPVGQPLAPGEERTLEARVTLSSSLLAKNAPYHGRVERLVWKVKEIPELVRYTEIAAGSLPQRVAHPSILTTPERMKEIQQSYADPQRRAELDKGLLGLVANAEKAMAYEPEYPPLAATGRDYDLPTGEKLVRIDVPNLPFPVYQHPGSGRTYSGPLYDSAMLGWLKTHLRNAQTAHTLALGYLVSGNREFARKAAKILLDYTEAYPKLPFIPYDQGSPVGTKVSGTTRIGGTYMRERTWLNDLVIALDSIRPADVLTPEQLAAITARVVQPSADGMMDHKVGVMNLQWMIQASALYAGLATEQPSLVARALHDSHGILTLMRVGFLPDGHWWENDSYQNVARLAAYPALITAVFNGIIPWDEKLAGILKSVYRYHAPDGHGPCLGTGGWAGYAVNDDAVTAFSALIRDPELAWIAWHRPGGRVLRTETSVMAAFRKATPPVPEAQSRSPIARETVNFPHYGGVALRVPGSDQYCYFHYGRELVHGHRNKLSINAYGAGHWYARNVTGGYQHRFADFLETIASANTIMVDHRNADTNTGELLFLKSVPGAELASARTTGAYKGVEHERSLVLTRHGLILLDRIGSDTERTYEWLYHADYTGLRLDPGAAEAVDHVHLGDTPFYEALKVKGRPQHFERLEWRREEGKGRFQGGGGMVQCLLPAQGELYSFDVTAAVHPGEGLLWRQKGKQSRFVAAYTPYRDDAAPAVTLSELPVRKADGSPATLAEGQAVEVRYPDQRVVVLINYSGGELATEGLRSADRVSVRLDPETKN